MMSKHPLLVLALCAAASATTALRAEVRTKEIEYAHGDAKLQGYLAWDDRFEGKRPGVLVVHEWWGLNDYARKRAEMLARLGYAAFALDMYGDGKVTRHPAQAREWAGEVRQNVESWRERARRGLDVLREQDVVDADRVAAIGYCFGGSTVLQLAFSGAPVKGVVSFHGALPEPDAEQLERVRARILVCHGAADPFIPREQVEKFQEALGKSDVDWHMAIYGGAKHSFTNPSAGEAGLDGLAYDREADERSWEHMKLFFRELFAEDE